MVLYLLLCDVFHVKKQKKLLIVNNIQIIHDELMCAYMHTFLLIPSLFI